VIEGRGDSLEEILSLTRSCVFVELFEGCSIGGFPGYESVRTATMYDCSRRGWTGKLGVLCKNQELVFFKQGFVGNELFALALGFGSLDTAEKHATGLSLQSGLDDWHENVKAKDREQLPNVR
jgi:hypothetical protein